LVALIAANTGLSIAQVRAEQQRRAAPRAAATDIPEVPATPG